MLTKATIIVVAAAFFASPAFVAAQDDTSLEHLVIEMASTPAHHAAIAQHYRNLAEEARVEMHRHENMGRAYSSGRIAQRSQSAAHCRRLAERFGEIAEEYDQLAQIHEEESEKGQ